MPKQKSKASGDLKAIIKEVAKRLEEASALSPGETNLERERTVLIVNVMSAACGMSRLITDRSEITAGAAAYGARLSAPSTALVYDERYAYFDEKAKQAATLLAKDIDLALGAANAYVEICEAQMGQAVTREEELIKTRRVGMPEDSD